jgi:mRNA-degrading endonuclease YafQ of YafQ-DinJ toxin-antitoxin module
LAKVLKTLLAQKPLESKYLDHPLAGNLSATRTGTHSDFVW